MCVIYNLISLGGKGRIPAPTAPPTTPPFFWGRTWAHDLPLPAYPLRAGTRLEVWRNRNHKDTLWRQLSTLRFREGAWQSASICSFGDVSWSVCVRWCLTRPSSDARDLGWAAAWLFGPSGYSVSHPKILIHYFSLYISPSWSPWLLESRITLSLELWLAFKKSIFLFDNIPKNMWYTL